ncbi:MAG: bifunctional transaldolase/phosoglucose isomerase [Chloroflexi bacterium]|nr:MAG: bifunctional transaldolase/phosoglucose isomerase [Chloroflexota bacterium]
MNSHNGNPNFDVRTYGQSFWYDNIQRSIITSGEMQSLIDDYGVLGLTSNPAIFEKAITGSADYDDDIIALAQRGADANAIYEALAIADIQSAADLLEPIYEQTNGLDGYVSLEVSPLLAHDYEGTVSEARRLFKLVGRKNLMVKVPATPAGIPAIQTLIADGININVTLIFSLDGYEAVARAYLAGLQERAMKGQSLDVASVASFFVSRVDTLVDRLLDEKIAALPEHDTAQRERLQALKGKAAIANAKLAYEIFERIFSEPAFKALADRGARVQRILWASTSTKNPAYKDTYYVEALIGEHTVNTLPPATLKAFRDHGVVAPTLREGMADARRTLEALEAVGISMQHVWQKLQDDGVRLFADAFESLLKGIEDKRAAVVARGEASGVSSALVYVEELVKMKAAARLWQREASLWTTAPEQIRVISNRLGWLSVIETMKPRVDELHAFREHVRSMGVTDAVVLGMGGSSLAPDVMRATFTPAEGVAGLRMHVLDTTDPTTVLSLERRLDLRKTLFIVASKSGSTLEVNAFYKYFRAKVDETVGETAGQHFVAITDEGTSLQRLAVEEGFGRVFINPADIGGRYSALSYFGLVPAALQGLDIAKLLARAAQMAHWCKPDSATNPGLYLGALMGGLALNGRDKVTFILSPQIEAFGDWVEQLIAESLGKQERGIVPVVGDLSADGAPVALRDTAHDKSGVAALSPDRFFVYMRLSGDATYDRFVANLVKAGLPVLTLMLSDAYDLGAEFFRWEFATAIAGVVIGVNPFDEPNVTESKVNTKRLLDEFEQSGAFSNEWTSRSANGQLNKFLRQAKPGDYIAIHAYLPYSDSVAQQLTRLRHLIREKTGVPVTVGYGPRFLHSTGQLHKGGANNVVALQLTYDPKEDVLIAGEPFSFGTLIRAQALGDFESLKAHQRRVLRLHLGADWEAALGKVIKVVSGGSRRSVASAKASEAVPRRARTKRTTKVKPDEAHAAAARSSVEKREVGSARRLV